MRRDKPTDIAAIRAWYFGDEEIELTEHQKHKRARLLQIQALMVKGRLNQDIVKKLEKDHGLSPAQAYRDIRDAVTLYGDMRKAEKEGIRFILYELALKVFQKAVRTKRLKEANQAMANLIKITGVDREDPDVPDFGKLDVPTILAVLPEGMHEFIQNKLKSGPIDLNEMAIAEEITEYEELETKEPIGADQGSN